MGAHSSGTAHHLSLQRILYLSIVADQARALYGHCQSNIDTYYLSKIIDKCLGIRQATQQSLYNIFTNTSCFVTTCPANADFERIVPRDKSHSARFSRAENTHRYLVAYILVSGETTRTTVLSRDKRRYYQRWKSILPKIASNAWSMCKFRSRRTEFTHTTALQVHESSVSPHPHPVDHHYATNKLG